jgi:nitronate monooxygenase
MLQKIGIRVPIIQAPMAGVSTPKLAAAVSNAGGLGSIAVGNVDAKAARDMIAAVRAETDRPFNVNVFCHAPPRRDAAKEARWIAELAPLFALAGAKPPTALQEIYTSFLEDDAMLELFVAEKPKVVSLHFGLPSAARLAALRKAGIFVIATATNLNEARAIEAAGLDAIVAQGFEAGGHRGMFDADGEDACLPTQALTELLVKQIELPIIAAGGLMDGADIKRALSWGAAAAQLGTAFIACTESAADAGYRAALQSDAAHSTVMTRAISGRAARCLKNKFTALGDQVAPSIIPAYPVAYDAGKQLHAAAKAKNDHGYGAHWAGTGAPRARTLSTAALIAALGEDL